MEQVADPAMPTNDADPAMPTNDEMAIDEVGD